MKEHASKELNDLDGVELGVIQNWLDRGRSEQLPKEAAQYLEYMEIARGQLSTGRGKTAVVKLLTEKPYSLSRYKAGQVFTDAMNFFYLDNQIKAEAWANYYAAKKERAADALLPLIATAKDHDSYQKAISDAAKLRLEYRAKEHNLPDEIFKKPVRIYTADVEIKGEGHKKVSRQELARLIDNYDVPESDRQRILAEAGVEPAILNLDSKS